MLKYIRKKLSFFKFLIGISLFKSTFNFWKAFIFQIYLYKSQLHFKINYKLKNSLNLDQNANEFLENGATLIQNKVTETVGKSISNKVDIKKKNKLWKKIEDYNSIYLKTDVLKTFPELENLLIEVIEPVLNRIYKSNYKIFFAVMFRSIPFLNRPIGSQLWHSDGAPGTCINVMFYPNGVEKNQGAMEFITWQNSKKLLLDCNKHIRNNFSNEHYNKEDIRNEKANFYKKSISKSNIEIKQPTSKKGAVLLFRNNCIHKGGFPKTNYERLSIIMNVYPHCDKPNYEYWFKNGRTKQRNLPLSPNFG